MMRAVVLLTILCGTAAAQSISVYSEFTRIDPSGAPVRADGGRDAPREILSPAIPRNAISSFHVVVEGRTGQPYSLQIAQNPANAVRVVAYRELYTQAAGEWIPDALERVTLPFDGKLGRDIPGQTAQAFWVDLIPDRSAPVRRIKVEPQVYIDDGWVRYPMEVRMLQTALGAWTEAPAAGSTDLAQPSAESAAVAWTRAVCGKSDETSRFEGALSIRNFIARNAAQDVRFAGGVVPPELLRIAGVADRAAFCRGVRLARTGAEEYLAVRDALVGARHSP